MNTSKASLPRTFYNRASKTSPPSSTATCDQNPQNLQLQPKSNSSIALHSKLFGVRKVLKKDESQLSNLLDEYKHGLDNPLIKTLINSNPKLLAQCLAYRYYVKGKICGDYVLSLHLQGQQTESRSRKRSIIKCNDSEKDVETVECSKGDHPVRKIPKVNNGNSYKCSTSQTKTTTTETILESVFSSDCLNHDIIAEDELIYLHDVLKELRILRKRHNDPSSYALSNNICNIKQPDLNDDTRILKNPYSSSLDHNMCQSKNIENDSESDDLNWLTHAMEQEWLQFLHFSDQKITSAKFHPRKEEVVKIDRNDDHCFKAYISLGKRNQQCDLGCFRSLQEAANVYDMYAIGRRTLGKIAMKEYDLRKRVKARSIFHRLNETLCYTDNVQKVVLNMSNGVNDFLNLLKSDSYFTSEKVLFPEMNTTVNWNHSAQMFGLDTSRYKTTTKEDQIDERLEIMLQESFTEDPPLDWLKQEVEEICREEENDKISDLLKDKYEEFKQMKQNIYAQITKLERLVFLEKSLAPLFHQGVLMDEYKIAMWKKKISA